MSPPSSMFTGQQRLCFLPFSPFFFFLFYFLFYLFFLLHHLLHLLLLLLLSPLAIGSFHPLVAICNPIADGKNFFLLWQYNLISPPIVGTIILSVKPLEFYFSDFFLGSFMSVFKLFNGLWSPWNAAVDLANRHSWKLTHRKSSARVQSPRSFMLCIVGNFHFPLVVVELRQLNLFHALLCPFLIVSFFLYFLFQRYRWLRFIRVSDDKPYEVVLVWGGGVDRCGPIFHVGSFISAERAHQVTQCCSWCRNNLVA